MAPLIVITGPTASGKTGLALELAEKYRGEIICADSRTVYRGMDIGTAKPTAEERARVPHHLLDVVEPGERFTARDFQRLAQQAIVDITSRGKIPFLVGGTGLYIDSVVLNYQFTADEHEKRQALSDKSVEDLQMMIKNQQIDMPINAKNKRHLVHAIISNGRLPVANARPDQTTHVVAITTEKEKLEKRIAARAEVMFKSGVIEEAKRLGTTYGWDSEAMTSNIYPILRDVIEGGLSREESIARCIVRDRQLAKRQITWLKRHDFVQWFTLDDARTFLDNHLSAIRGREAEL